MKPNSKQCEKATYTAKPRKTAVLKQRKPNIKASRPSFADTWTPEEHARWLKKARRKWLGFSVASHLFFENPDSPLRKSYRNSIYCTDSFTPNPNDNDRPHAHYCKNRWCPTCGAIRTAKLIKGYLPQIEEMDDLWFLTLTRPTCTAEELPEQIKRMTKAFRQIVHRNKWRKKLNGIRKSECTIRPDDLYHFHFHILIDGYENAKYIRESWLKLFPDCDPKGQDLTKATSNTVFEVFKYFTKLTVKTYQDPEKEKKKKKKKKQEREIMDYKRMDIIFQAMRGKRTVQPFGNISPVSEEFTEEELDGDVEILEIFHYIKEQSDWIGEDTGLPLTGYKPSANFRKLTQYEVVISYPDPPPD